MLLLGLRKLGRLLQDTDFITWGEENYRQSIFVFY